MTFSICIPNYNYERYLGRTIQSVLDQSGIDLEILVSDNASTDGSMNVVRGFNDPRIKVHVNNVNVGFAGNLDRAARMATGDFVIMLSSDDLILPGTLQAYANLMAKVAHDRPAVVSSSWDVINANDEVIDKHNPDSMLWLKEDRVPELDELVGGPVYRVAGDTLLKRCLGAMRNPFNFAATCYSRSLYDTIEGYGGGPHVQPRQVVPLANVGVYRVGLLRRPPPVRLSLAQQQPIQLAAGNRCLEVFGRRICNHFGA